jgi:DNA-binding CsgD family transcriptional regulator
MYHSRSGLVALKQSEAFKADRSDEESRPQLTYVLHVDAARQSEIDALIARIPGVRFYSISSNRDRPREAGAGQLSQRLEQVLLLVGQGMSNKCIGRQLGISHFTVRNHVARLLRLYGAKNRDELIALMQAPEAP